MLLLGVALGWTASAAGAGLPLWKTCGEIRCLTYQYCSDLTCMKCEDVCLETGHNFDRPTCEKECQDYIHDKVKHYLTEGDSLKATKDLQDTIELLRQLVAASLILSLLVGLVVTFIVGFLWLRYRRKTAPKEMDLIDTKIQTVSSMVNNNCKEKPPRFDMSSTVSNTAAPSVMTATTPISTRHPCEDATLEYAYDNQGMTPSPVLQEQRNETTF